MDCWTVNIDISGYHKLGLSVSVIYTVHIVGIQLKSVSIQVHLMENEILVQERLKLILRMCTCVTNIFEKVCAFYIEMAKISMGQFDSFHFEGM